MKQERSYRLQRQVLMQLIQDQALKHYLVAQNAGVHRTTLRRWLQGSIGRVKETNVELLANSLCVRPSQIVEGYRVMQCV